MTIRLAAAGDLNAIAQLYFQNHRKTYAGLLPDAYFAALSLPECRRRWEAFLSSPGKKIWVAYGGPAFLGFAAAESDPELTKTWYLDSLHVAENSRGRGVGSALIRTAGAFALQNHFEKMSVCIVRGNEGARKLYCRLGASHFEFFEDTFLGVPSNSEKLIWNRIPC